MRLHARTREARQLVVDLYRELKTVRAVATRTGLDRATVSRLLRTAGVDVRLHFRHGTNNSADVAQMVREIGSPAKVARLLGIHRVTVHYHMRRAQPTQPKLIRCQQCHALVPQHGRCVNDHAMPTL